MNEASPEKPRRPFKRMAAATATLFGAALITTPGTAAAQTEVDCSSLGDVPTASSLNAAFEAAVACDFEVRIRNRSQPYSTLYVTPQGRLHLVATADPDGSVFDDGPADPTLESSGGLLSQTFSSWYFYLRDTDPEAPLLWAYGALDWTGEIPAPEVAGATATYPGLAAGLDLAVEVDVASAELSFTVADTEAWEALASGLVLEEADGAVVEDDALHLYGPDDPDGTEVRTTPFAARDANGAFSAVDLTLGGDGALSLSLPEGALDAAAFPLTVTTQWAYSGYGISEWGSVSSAAPDLAAYRGGDALVGAEAGSYWNFYSPLKIGYLRLPDYDYDWDFPVAEATFSVDAKPGTACAAPDLDPVADYGTTVTWNRRPATVGDPVPGSCQDGTASYDVTGSVADAWEADPSIASEVAFGMTDSAETAAFLGGSGRLDVFFDIVGFMTNTWCSKDPSAPNFYRSGVDGSTYAEGWRPDVIDLDLTWTATVRDYATGETILTTAPSAIPVEGGRVGAISDPLADGRYTVDYRFASGTTDVTRTADTCHFTVDTSSPDIVAVEVEPGSHTVGDTVGVTVTVADDGFPDGINRLEVSLHRRSDWATLDRAVLTDGATADLAVTLTDTTTQFHVQVEDAAFNETITDEPLTVTARHPGNDFNGDGRQDLMAVRKSDGNMVFHAGKGDGTFAAGVAEGAGWGDIDPVMAGDLNGDDRADLLGRDNKTGRVHLYPGDGTGGWGPRVQVFSGWNAMGAFTSGGDFNGDGKIDLLAVKQSDGKLYLHPGKGDGTFGTAVAVASGWNVFDTVTTVGDVDEDGDPDVLARDSRTGAFHLYHGNGANGFESTRTAVDASLVSPAQTRRYSEVSAVGDLDRDGHQDVVAIDSRTGELVLHSFATDGTALHEGEVVAAGWGSARLPAPVRDGAFDFNGDGTSDVVGRQSSNATTYFYPGNGTGGFGSRTSLGTGFSGMNVMESAGDMTGDGRADLLAREASTGDLYVYPGDGSGGFTASARVKVGAGWNAMSMIAGGYDYNGDGKADLLARTSSGTLYLYPGNGAGKVGSRLQIGTGWNAWRELEAVGDYNHDGHADLIAIKTSDNCMHLFRGNGNGTFDTPVSMGCGWSYRNAITAVGDFDRDGHVDWLSRRRSDGYLFLHSGNGSTGYTSRQIGTGWGGFDQIA